MSRQSDFPDKWVCESDEKDAIVEVRDPTGKNIQPQLSVSYEVLGGPTGNETTNMYQYGGNDEDVFVEVNPKGEGKDMPILSELFVNISDDGNGYGLNLELFTYDGENDRYVATVPDSEIDGEVHSIRLNGAQAYEWIEIPTTQVEMWHEKGKAASIQRTAKVKFPTEWGQTPPSGEHNSPRRLIEQYNPDEARPFMLGRVKVRDDDGVYVTNHLGWIGGVGDSSDEGESKMWIYDFAEFFSGIAVSESFNNPSIEEVSDRITQIIMNNTMVPLSGSAIVAPQTEEELSRFVSGSLEEGDIRGTAATLSTNTQYYSLSNDDEIRVDQGELFDNIDGNGVHIIGGGDKLSLNTAIIDTKEGKFIPFEPDSTHFTANRDTLIDILDWFEQKSQAKVHFEPSPTGNGVIAMFDIVPSRRKFVQNEVAQLEFERQGDKIKGHEVIDVRKNNALYEMKPQNTVELRGAKPSGKIDAAQDIIEDGIGFLTGNPNMSADKYPVAKVQVPSLLEAAEGVEVSGKLVESDARSVDDAVREAKRKMQKVLEEPSEGQIVTDIQAHLLPYDEIVSYETCQDQIAYEQNPISYEAESVKHTIRADGQSGTEIDVSIFVGETQIKVVRGEMVGADKE